MSRLLVVTPMRNEAAHVGRLARAIAAQTRPPDAWILVDDGSTDATAQIAAAATLDLPFARVIAAPPGGSTDIDRRLAEAAEAIAFNAALDKAGAGDFDLVGKLDADIEPPSDWLARLEAQMHAEPRLGIVGGALAEPGPRGWRRVRSPDYHVHGAVKLYRQACLQQIGGVRPMLGWDTIDETYARMRGWTTRSLPDLVARHHRPCGEGGSRLRGRARYGRCAYIARYDAGWVALRSLKVAASDPVIISGAAFAWGYLDAARARAPRVEDEDFRRFVRAELWGRALRRVRLR